LVAGARYESKVEEFALIDPDCTPALTDELRIKIVREAEVEPVTKVAARHGITDRVIYQWRRRFFSSTRTMSP
jgi:hypothetical protein